MGTVHIHAPEATHLCYRLLVKGCTKFDPEDYETWSAAFDAGLLKHRRTGFRVYAQRSYEWYDPTNTELIKVNPALANEMREDTDQ